MFIRRRTWYTVVHTDTVHHAKLTTRWLFFYKSKKVKSPEHGLGINMGKNLNQPLKSK